MCFKIFFLIILTLKLSATSQNQTLDCKSIPSDFCGPNAACFDDPTDVSFIRHEGPYCKCFNGFVGAPKCAKYCKFLEVCSDNEYCSVANGWKCVKGCVPDKCPKGQICNLWTRSCVDGCNNDQECDDSEYCSRGNFCAAGCRSGFYSKCGDGQICDEKSRKCIDGCEGDSGCKDDEYCNEHERKCYKGCRSNGCGQNQVCDDGTCIDECIDCCSHDENCNSDEYCDRYNSKCAIGCRLRNCPFGQICDVDTRECTAGCSDDSSCGKNEFCNKIDQKCQKGCRISKTRRCEENCEYEYSCDSWYYCDKDTRQCRMGCQHDSECPTDKYCNLDIKTCQTGCRLNLEFMSKESVKCPPGEACNVETRKCRPGCEIDNHCKFYQFCDRKSQKCELGPRQLDCPQHTVFDLVKRGCRDGCQEDQECQQDEYCNQVVNKCEKICEKFSCGKNSICEGRDHMKHCSCLDGFVSKKERGCKRIEATDNLSSNCHKFCGEYSDCYRKDNRIFCYCTYKKNGSDDPFYYCVGAMGFASGSGFSRQSAESEISVADAMALFG